MRLVRAVRHIGQNAEKFRFDLKIENLHVFLHEECEISIDWIRGPKRISGKESVSCVNGSIIHPFYEPMVLIATLFQKSHKSGKSILKDVDPFLPKDSRLVIYGKFKDNPLSLVIGEVPLDLSYYANSYKSSGVENIDPIRVEIPLIKCSDPNSYIEIYINCLSLGQVSDGFDDTASMMSGFTTVYSEITESPKISEFKMNLENNLPKLSKKNKNLELKNDKISNEFSLGIPMFSIKEDSELNVDNVKETEEMTETGTIVDIETNDNINLKDKDVQKNNFSTHIPTYYPNPIIKVENDSLENISNNDNTQTSIISDNKASNKNTDQNCVKSYSHSSSSFEILTQRLYMEQEEYKRKINEYNMEIKSLKQQLQIYSEQEKSWKQREADLMNEIKQLRNNDDVDISVNSDINNLEKNKFDKKKSHLKHSKVVDLNDYCLLQQEVSELTGIRDELRRLRESDRYKYERYISQLENQLEDIKKQLEYYQRNGQIQDEVEAELFSIPRHPTSYNTARSQVSEYISSSKNTISSININNFDQKSKYINTNDNLNNENNNDNEENQLKFSYGYEEIEKELISTKLALAQTETNYQIEINNLRSKIDKQKKQLLSYSSYVGNLEVINADLKYKTKKTDIKKVIDENSIRNENEFKTKSTTNAINSYWKSFKQKIK